MLALPFTYERWGMITINNIMRSLFSLMIGFMAFMFVSARRRNVSFHSMEAFGDGISDKKLSVFFISDIHRRKIDDKLIAKIQFGHSIDVVIIGGDLAERGVPLTRIAKNVRKLAQLGPLFYIWGNNDREAGEQEIRDIIIRHGGQILENENVVIPGHPHWGIAGTDDPSNGNVDIESTLHRINQFENVIVVTHMPSLFSKVEQVYQPRLMLAGHTHGGQIRIGKYGLQDKGTFRIENGRAKLISNGYGTSMLPLRLGAAPESHVIVINYA